MAQILIKDSLVSYFMATNKCTIKLLEDMYNLIENLNENLEGVRELKIMNKTFKKHITEQKRQGGQYPNDNYNPVLESTNIQRRRNGEVVAEY